MKTPICILSCGILFLSGCSSPYSPVKPAARKGGVTGSQLVATGAGAAAGAAIGNELGGDQGAIIGGVAGAVVGAVGSTYAANRTSQELAEVDEQARREERVRVMTQYWNDRAIDSDPNATSTRGAASGDSGAPQQEMIFYPAGVYEGVLYGPRLLPAPATK